MECLDFQIIWRAEKLPFMTPLAAVMECYEDLRDEAYATHSSDSFAVSLPFDQHHMLINFDKWLKGKAFGCRLRLQSASSPFVNVHFTEFSSILPVWRGDLLVKAIGVVEMRQTLIYVFAATSVVFTSYPNIVWSGPHSSLLFHVSVTEHDGLFCRLYRLRCMVEPIQLLVPFVLYMTFPGMSVVFRLH